MNVSVKEEMIKYFETKAKRKYWLPEIGRYYPSILCQPCLKAMWNYYKMASEQKKFPPGYLLQTGEGIVTHEIIESFKFWDKVEVPVKKIVKASDGWIKIFGRADAVLGDTVYDFKRTQRIPNKVKFQHRLQLNFYMDCLGKPKGIVCYIGYNSEGEFDVQERPIVLTDWYSAQIINRAIQLHDHLRYNDPPICSCRSRRHDIEWERYLMEKQKGGAK